MDIRLHARDEHGASLTEYVLLASLIAIALIAAIGIFGTAVGDLLQRSADAVP